MKRRAFLAALAALPFVGRLVKAMPAPAAPVVQRLFIGSYAACCYQVGHEVDRISWRPTYMGIVDTKRRPWVVSHVDYEQGIVTIQGAA